jgi:hypothetical protein
VDPKGGRLGGAERDLMGRGSSTRDMLVGLNFIVLE